MSEVDWVKEAISFVDDDNIRLPAYQQYDELKAKYDTLFISEVLLANKHRWSYGGIGTLEALIDSYVERAKAAEARLAEAERERNAYRGQADKWEQQFGWQVQVTQKRDAQIAALVDVIEKIKALDEDDFKSAYHYQTAVRFHAEGALEVTSS